MNKTIIIAVGGVVAGVAVALGIFMFVLGGDSKAAEEPVVPIRAEGRLGPHIKLADRIYNLQAPVGTQAYVKMQAIIEFETPLETTKDWAYVFKGCVADLTPRAPVRLVSLDPVPAAASEVDATGESVDPCTAKEHELQAEFEHEIGTGIALIEDAVLTTVSKRTAADVSTPEGKEALKADIKKAVEKIIHHPKVTRVLFTNFITQ
ncbi:MAG: flagellar basal body-associated FliL family protein [Dehalococcoidia bacterium]